MVRRKEDFRGKRIVIAGGGDSAVEWALSLAPISEKLYIVHRRDKFRAAPESVRQMDDLVKKGQIEMIVPYQLHDLRGQDKKISEVIVQTLDGQELSLTADVLLPFYGLSTELGPIGDWGLAVDHKNISVDPATCQTSIEGIYAIGDIAAYKNKLKLILTGFNEAAFAAHAIHHWMYPDKELHFEYSTTKGVPGAA
jgi:thioredoxin reductase (NADPH)